jgi:hypothetical protein
VILNMICWYVLFQSFGRFVQFVDFLKSVDVKVETMRYTKLIKVKS